MSRPIGDKLAPGLDEESVAGVWRRVAAARRERPRARRRRAMIGLASLSVSAIALVLLLRAPAPVPPLRVAGLPLVPGATPSERRWQLNDGSTVRLGDRAALEVVSNENGRFVTKLEGGRARFDVTPGGPRRWIIETSLATVEVVGTAFDIDDSPRHVAVHVDRGVVLVQGERVPGRIVRLVAGQDLVIDAEPVERPALAPTLVPAPTTAPAPAAPAPAAPALLPPSLPPLPAAPASAQAAAQAPARTQPAADDGALAQALADADLLRAHGQARAAAERLERAIAEHPGDPGLGVAAFSLGRLYLEVLDEPALAAEAFALVVNAGRPAGLLEDARARRTEALIAAGRLDEAARALAQMEAAFPGSARAARLRTQLEAARVP
jgi:transmembrane sensor